MDAQVINGPIELAGAIPLAQLGAHFVTPLAPTPVPAPYWVGRNEALAAELEIDADWFASAEALAAFAGNAPLPGAEPLASVYSGHQFGTWAGQLGDGRALLLGATAGGQQLQLKGSGRTPYSRGADGRAVLRSTIREYLCSAAMHALGIPTTRALCIAGSDLPVVRETIETAAVLTRVAPSFIRFGHFEHCCHNGSVADLRALADFVIERHYPAAALAPHPYADLLARVLERTARLIAEWQAAGFMHGVMNTDNMSILGLTLDYGPFQFMDAFDPAHICNHSDQLGRYAYQNQPAIAHWNLCALATALLPLIGDTERAKAVLDTWPARFGAAMAAAWARKLGCAQASAASSELAHRLLELLAQEHGDYPLFWSRLTDYAASGDAAALRAPVGDGAALGELLAAFDALAEPGPQRVARMRAANPAVVLRNWMAEEVIKQAQQKHFAPLQELLIAVQHPQDVPPGHASWMAAPPAWASAIQISCSS